MVAIDSADTHEQMIWKAAHVVPTKRQMDWQRLELTAFAHFGMNTFCGNSWGDGKEDPKMFNPSAFDADQWVTILSDCGFKSLILTCKHHDGFCLWPSAYTDHSVKNSIWRDGKGDVVCEVADACRRKGLKFGVYLSPWDRHEQSYGTDAYNDFFVNQLTELLTQYGDICEVWLDGACGEGPNGKRQVYDVERWVRLVRRLQPDAVVAIIGPDVRWVGTEIGKGRETEWSVIPNDNLDPDLIASHSQQDIIVPPISDKQAEDLGSREKVYGSSTLVWYPAETDVSIRPNWFYMEKDDGKTKSAETLMNIYFTSVGRNGSLLLNVPPDKRGLICEEDERSLRQFAGMREALFARNLATEAKVMIDGKSSGKARRVSDGNYDSSIECRCPSASEPLEIGWQWTTPQQLSIVSLQEDIRHGQRVEAFTIEYKTDDGTWKVADEGTTIGYKRLLRFDPVMTTEVRLTITEARHNPVIAEIGIY